MFAKRLIPGLLLLLGPAWVAFAQETITIALDDTARFRTAATATLSGTVTPVDASLSLDGTALAVERGRDHEDERDRHGEQRRGGREASSCVASLHCGVDSPWGMRRSRRS